MQLAITAEAASSVWSLPGIRLEVFQVKWFGQEWPSNPLMNVVQLGRARYKEFYGDDAPAFDHYDNKAAAYAVRASYEICAERFSEWFSMRMVPGSGEPGYTEDLLYYRSRRLGLTPAQMLTEGPGSPVALTEVFSAGRMAVARPLGDKGGRLCSNRAVGLCVICALDQFIKDLADQGGSCSLLTTQMAARFAQRCIDVKTKRWDEARGLPAGDVALDRNVPELRRLCYGFPAYFLNPADTSQLLQNAYRQGWLTASIIERLLPEGRALEAFFDSPKFRDLKHMGVLFSSPETLGMHSVTGDQLRRDADRYVSDGTALLVLSQPALQLAFNRLYERHGVVLNDGVFAFEGS